jgi:hypothetical protein
MKAFYFVSLIFISNLTLAANIGYEVEVIIFEDTSELYKNSENWPLPVSIEKTIEKIDLKTEDNKTEQDSLNIDKEVFFEYIDDKNYRLNQQAKKLLQHANYNIMYHKAWKQPGLNKDSAKAVIINTQDYINTEDDKNKSQSFIVGEFTLIMSRYLHVFSKLTLHKPIKDLSKNNTYSEYKNIGLIDTDNTEIYTQYPLLFERKMRSKEIHFIDHPMGGMIVLVVPYKIEAEEEQAAEGYNIL